MNFLERWAKITPAPKPLWKWVLVQGSSIGLLFMSWWLISDMIFSARGSPEGVNLSTLLSAARAVLSDTERVRKALIACLTGGFFLGLLAWSADYKRSIKVGKQ